MPLTLLVVTLPLCSSYRMNTPRHFSTPGHASDLIPHGKRPAAILLHGPIRAFDFPPRHRPPGGRGSEMRKLFRVAV